MPEVTNTNLGFDHCEHGGLRLRSGPFHEEIFGEPVFFIPKVLKGMGKNMPEMNKTATCSQRTRPFLLGVF